MQVVILSVGLQIRQFKVLVIAPASLEKLPEATLHHIEQSWDAQALCDWASDHTDQAAMPAQGVAPLQASNSQGNHAIRELGQA